jgi:RNA polymerase sigma-B factor
VLVKRCTTNRLILRETYRRMDAVCAEAREARSVSQRLRQEVRSGLDRRAEGIAAARRWNRPDRARLRPVRTPEADSLDVVRQQLHETYAATGNPAIRAELMESYDGFARSLALRFRNRDSVDDLMQVARIGLLHAIDRFDPALGRPFPLFARITITGELKRHLRDRTWAVRVPRSLQEDYLSVMRAVDELTNERSNSPSMEAIADRCGISVEQVVEAMELRLGQRPLSIDGPAGPDQHDPVMELAHDDIGFDQLDNRELLSHLLGRLPERDRRILELRFFREMTQAEIATEIGVSQMCISRVLARTLGRLRSWARTAELAS